MTSIDEEGTFVRVVPLRAYGVQHGLEVVRGAALMNATTMQNARLAIADRTARDELFEELGERSGIERPAVTTWSISELYGVMLHMSDKGQLVRSAGGRNTTRVERVSQPKVVRRCGLKTAWERVACAEPRMYLYSTTSHTAMTGTGSAARGARGGWTGTGGGGGGGGGPAEEEWDIPSNALDAIGEGFFGEGGVYMATGGKDAALGGLEDEDVEEDPLLGALEEDGDAGSLTDASAAVGAGAAAVTTAPAATTRPAAVSGAGKSSAGSSSSSSDVTPSAMELLRQMGLTVGGSSSAPSTRTDRVGTSGSSTGEASSDRLTTADDDDAAELAMLDPAIRTSSVPSSSATAPARDWAMSDMAGALSALEDDTHLAPEGVAAGTLVQQSASQPLPTAPEVLPVPSPTPATPSAEDILRQARARRGGRAVAAASPASTTSLPTTGPTGPTVMSPATAATATQAELAAPASAPVSRPAGTSISLATLFGAVASPAAAAPPSAGATSAEPASPAHVTDRPMQWHPAPVLTASPAPTTAVRSSGSALLAMLTRGGSSDAPPNALPTPPMMTLPGMPVTPAGSQPQWGGTPGMAPAGMMMPFMGPASDGSMTAMGHHGMPMHGGGPQPTLPAGYTGGAVPGAFPRPMPWIGPQAMTGGPGASNPGVHPGMMYPMHPGMMHPGMMHPGMMHPGMMHPGMVHPGMPVQPRASPGMPASAPMTLTPAAVFGDSRHVSAPVAPPVSTAPRGAGQASPSNVGGGSRPTTVRPAAQLIPVRVAAGTRHQPG